MFVAARVRAGAALLDRSNPIWTDRVDPGRLDTKSFKECMLAQLYGDYVDGARSLNQTNAGHTGVSWWGVAHGFFPLSQQDSLNLDKEWKTVILARQTKSLQRSLQPEVA